MCWRWVKVLFKWWNGSFELLIFLCWWGHECVLDRKPCYFNHIAVMSLFHLFIQLASKCYCDFYDCKAMLQCSSAVCSKTSHDLSSLISDAYFVCAGAHFHLDCNKTNVLDKTNSIGHLSWKPNNNRTFLSCSLEQRVLNGKFSAMTENNTQSNSSTVHTGLKSN